MTNSSAVSEGFTPSFAAESGPTGPPPLRLPYRQAYYYLVNVDEHPEILPWSYDLVRSRLGAHPPGPLAAIPGSVSELVENIAAVGLEARPWRQAAEDLTRRQALHYFMQYMPTALVDGCWLQCSIRVSTAHTPLGSTLTALYAHQVRAYAVDPGRHFVGDYRATYGRLGAPLEEVSSHSFANRPDILDSSFVLPTTLLSIAQFPRTFLAEIIGLNLAWQFLELSGFGPALIRDVCDSYGLPPLSGDVDEAEHVRDCREKALKAAAQLVDQGPGAARGEALSRLTSGAALGIALCTEWFSRTRASAPTGPPDPRREMLDLLWRKAPHATGYHAEKRLGERRIDEHLEPATFDGPAVLEELARSRWVKAGQSDRSGLLRHLVKFGGPMLGVFSPVELRIIQDWINSLPRKAPAGSPEVQGPPPPVLGPLAPRGREREAEFVSGHGWSPDQFRERSRRLYAGCTVRELFYYLVNVERHPDILPIAEQFARDRLERSLAMIRRGERPIPSRRYDPSALERWVYEKHRQQVQSYRPPAVRPPVAKDLFIEATVQLAPIILIDGAWLQGVASAALIHTAIGRMLFHVLIEEIGAGNAEEHHANIYRKLLAAMGEDAPPVESWEFARWPRLKDSSFDVPTLWLSLSCFPRHFLPEILGLNLAVELAGIGGPYMEARDTLRRFGFPTLFVDVHNAADNVAAGHSAWAMNTIKRYMDELAEREGPHSLDYAWRRVWSGVRATLPQTGRLRLMAYRLRQRLFGEERTTVPVIFPS